MLNTLILLALTGVTAASPEPDNQTSHLSQDTGSQNTRTFSSLEQLLLDGHNQEFDNVIQTTLRTNPCSSTTLKPLKQVVKKRSVIGHHLTGSFNNANRFDWINPPPNLNTDALHIGRKLLFIWDKTCIDCHAYAFNLEKIVTSSLNIPMDMVGLTSLSQTTKKEIKNVIEQHKMTLHTAVVAQKMLRGIRVETLPEVILLVQGKIIWKGHPDDLNRSITEHDGEEYNNHFPIGKHALFQTSKRRVTVQRGGYTQEQKRSRFMNG